MSSNKSPWGSGSSGGSNGGSGSGSDGGSGGGKTPWGQGGSGGSGGGNNGGNNQRPRPTRRPAQNPLDDLLKRFGSGGSGGGGAKKGKGGGTGRRVGPFGIFLIVILLAALFSCFYTVDQQEEALVFRFGKYKRSAAPGLNFKFPSPIETVIQRKTKEVTEKKIGGSDAASLMLTGDENIVDIEFTVLWRISDLYQYIINVDETDVAVGAVAESAMREIVGKNELEKIITTNRQGVTISVRDLMQEILDEYEAGVDVVEVQLQKANPPEGEVTEAFRDVVNAEQDAETYVNEATAYQNKIVPTARGEAAQIIQDGEAYRDQVIAIASGEAQRFTFILEEYQAAPRVTRYRMYLETMEEVYGPANKMILDGDSGSGVVPYLPLDELSPRKRGGN